MGDSCVNDFFVALPQMSIGENQRAACITHRKHPLAIVQNIEGDKENAASNPNNSSTPTIIEDSNLEREKSESDILNNNSPLSSILRGKDLACIEFETEALLNILEEPDIVSSMSLIDLDTVLQALEEYHAAINAMRHTDQHSDDTVENDSFPKLMVDGRAAEERNAKNRSVNEQTLEDSNYRNYKMIEGSQAAESVLEEDMTNDSMLKEVAAIELVVQKPTTEEHTNIKRSQVLTEEATMGINSIIGVDSPKANTLKGVTSQTPANVAVIGKYSSKMEKPPEQQISRNITIRSAKAFHHPFSPIGGFQYYLCGSLATTFGKVQGIVNGMADVIR